MISMLTSSAVDHVRAESGQIKDNKICISCFSFMSTKWTSSFHRNVTCSHYDITENLFSWLKTTINHNQIIEGSRDHMVVGYLQLYVHLVPITTKVVSSNPIHDKVYSIQHYTIKFSSDLRQVCGFLWFSTNKTDHHNITEILLKVALNTINQPKVNLLQKSH